MIDEKEQKRIDDCLAGEHEYDPDGEMPDYLRDWAKERLGVEIPASPDNRTEP